MRMSSARQLKDWLRNKEKQEGIPANTLINFYMMERLLERIAISRFKDMFIIKGGFLIASMIGVDLRSTLDLDTTIRGLSVDKKTIIGVMNEIMAIEIDDRVSFRLVSLGSIHEEGQYEDFRLTVEAAFFTIRVLIKIDVTTGDRIIPSEIVYAYRLMFEDRIISVKAYNLLTILAEKIESILARNIANTRAKDYYDMFTLLTLKKSEINLSDLGNALAEKTRERKTGIYLERYPDYLIQIQESLDLHQLWSNYQKQYSYAAGISFIQMISLLGAVLDETGYGPMTLHSERLLFREFQEADRPLVYQLLSDPVVMRYAYHDAYETESEFQPYFDRILRNNGSVDRREVYAFAVFLASDHRFVGMCDLEIEQFGESGGNAELGYFLAPAFWGCGYATEIARELLRFGFSGIGLHRISARCHADNAASENVMKKIGMSREGIFSKARFKNGTWHDELRYAVTTDR